MLQTIEVKLVYRNSDTLAHFQKPVTKRQKPLTILKISALLIIFFTVSLLAQQIRD